MKKPLLLLLSFLLWSLGYSQSVSPEVTASSGDHFIGTNVQLSWTIGETMIKTYVNNSNQLTQGFHQTNLMVTSCSDGIQNGNETGVDCGGLQCGLCNTYYADADGDNYGDADSSVSAATAPPGYVANSGDCDDSNNEVNPAASEICNGTDDNCNGEVDEELVCNGCHDGTLPIHSADIPSNTYRASVSITSSGTVQSESTVVFLAGQTITLQPGFHAQSGSIFTARIDACNPELLAQVAQDDTANDGAQENQRFSEIPNEKSAEVGLSIFPNPFRNETTIRYTLPEERPLQLVMVDMLGRVKVLQSATVQQAGTHEFRLSSVGLGTGIYFIQLQTPEEVISQKAQVVR